MLVDRILEFPQALWLLAFTFYAIDVGRLIAPGCLPLREKGGGLTPALAAFPFEIASKELSLAGLLMPWRAVLLARWSGDADPDAQALDRISDVLAALLPLRIASTCNFVCLFLLAPVLTGAIGLGGALLVVVPFVYSVNLIAGVHVLARRPRFGLARNQAAWLLFDVLLCAPYGANWVKRIVRLQPTVEEGIAQLRDRMSSADFERLSGAIALRKTEMNTTEE